MFLVFNLVVSVHIHFSTSGKAALESAENIERRRRGHVRIYGWEHDTSPLISPSRLQNDPLNLQFSRLLCCAIRREVG
jgi:hypothetical protein